MRLKRILIIGTIFPVLFSIVLFFGILISGEDDDSSNSYSPVYSGMNLSADVLKHQPMVERYARENGISEYVNVLLAIIQVERKLEEIMDELEQGVQSILTSENYMNYLKFLSSFHSYSLNNTILIYHQKPDASLVAGYRKWQSLGRQVQQFHALRYTKGEEYGGRYELIAGNCLIGPTSENPYLTKPAVSQAIKDAKNYLEQKEKSHEKQGKHLKITERSKTLPTKKVKEQER